jgi:hypothetical protein
MNERIRELEKLCWDSQSNCLNAQKFAELIVKECAQVCRDHTNIYALKTAIAIKKHFGVEK